MNPPHEPGYLTKGGSPFFRAEREFVCKLEYCGAKFVSISPNAKYCQKHKEAAYDRNNKRIAARRRRKELGLD